MATPSRPVRRPPSLAPSRWPTLPRRGTALRLALAALLLTLAAGVVYAREPQPSCPEAAATGPDAAPPDLSGSSPAGPRPPGDPRSPSDPRSPADPGTPDGPRSPDDPRSPAGAALPLPAGTVGVPIRLAEPAALAVVRPGTRVDLLATGAGGRSTGPALVAARALVLGVLTADPTMDGPTALYLALPPGEAHRAIALPDGTRFAITVLAQ
ncbi:flagellar biosynthesis protein FlgA [Micromonospora sp. NBC_01796]|uniref:flagellar biosynthesis protein FlgA n=1 Tax=Micromonospora sp. NBC_01796 TaxID=2975987 RepID=UPI002DD7D19E|nr:flagellar biosynthesis protein FlgA [Micromonospora sp. NBC_01796]WSA89141.1 flagellar biosynthesis protein FlgA [Micromonospora sp. NBC_01796]